MAYGDKKTIEKLLINFHDIVPDLWIPAAREIGQLYPEIAIEIITENLGNTNLETENRTFRFVHQWVVYLEGTQLRHRNLSILDRYPCSQRPGQGPNRDRLPPL